MQTPAEELISTMRMLGDISKGNADKFKRLAFAFSEVRGNTRLMGQEARQMIAAGFAPLVQIARITGEEVSEVKKRMELGQVSFDNAFA